MACVHGPPRPKHLGPFRLPPRKRIVQLQPVARVALVFEQGGTMILNASPRPAWTGVGKAAPSVVSSFRIHWLFFRPDLFLSGFHSQLADFGVQPS